MARFIRIKSTWSMTIDLNDPEEVKRNKDLLDMVLKDYNETLDEGEEPFESLTAAQVDDAVLHDVIRAEMEDDIEGVVDVSDVLDTSSFEIEILS